MTTDDASDSGPRWTPVARAAQLAGVHVDTLRNWARRNEVRSMRDNRRRLMIDLGDLGRRQDLSATAYDGAEDTTQGGPRSSPMTALADELRERIEELRAEVERERAAREKEVERLRQDHAAEVARLRADHTAELERLHERLAEALAPRPGFLERVVAVWRRPRQE